MPRFSILNNRKKPRQAKPPWLKVRAPGGGRYESIKRRLEGLNLHTVCQEAQCPNIGECWDGGTATIMLMGGTCTRGCRFCAVQTSPAPPALDPNEPRNAAEAVVAMGVDYIVMTSVNRDDLADGGAAHFAETVVELKQRDPDLMVEVLVPDFQGNSAAIDILAASGPEVIAHNVETVRRLSRAVRDARASFDQSLQVLRDVKRAGRGKGPKGSDILAKTSIMCGLGETEEEVISAMTEVREAGCDVITFGQYLQPSGRHIEVSEYVTPEVYERYAEVARSLGFAYVASGPLVRSSYKAAEFYLRAHIDAAAGKVVNG
ncbi:MAG: lipoyl synthase [Myxococcota bacterium]